MTTTSAWRDIPTTERHTLLALHRGALAQACVAKLREQDDMSEPTEEQRLALTFRGLVTRDTHGRAVLSPRGQAVAELLARAIATKLDIHIVKIWRGGLYYHAACNCGWNGKVFHAAALAAKLIEAEAELHQGLMATRAARAQATAVIPAPTAIEGR